MADMMACLSLICSWLRHSGARFCAVCINCESVMPLRNVQVGQHGSLHWCTHGHHDGGLDVLFLILFLHVCTATQHHPPYFALPLCHEVCCCSWRSMSRRIRACRLCGPCKPMQEFRQKGCQTFQHTSCDVLRHGLLIKGANMC